MLCLFGSLGDMYHITLWSNIWNSKYNKQKLKIHTIKIQSIDREYWLKVMPERFKAVIKALGRTTIYIYIYLCVCVCVYDMYLNIPYALYMHVY